MEETRDRKPPAAVTRRAFLAVSAAAMGAALKTLFGRGAVLAASALGFAEASAPVKPARRASGGPIDGFFVPRSPQPENKA